MMPDLVASTAYNLLRPFVKQSPNGEDWELDLESSMFPGTTVRGAQELNETTHPHLRLDKTMVSIPLIEPGDQVYCKYMHTALISCMRC